MKKLVIFYSNICILIFVHIKKCVDINENVPYLICRKSRVYLEMMEQQLKRVERAVADMINEMYSSHLRKMQSEMHLCASKCCDDKCGTLDFVQTCTEGCAIPLTKAQDYLQHKLGQLQGRLQNCVMKCSEEARKRLPPNLGEVDLSKYRYQFENCAVACVMNYDEDY